MGEFIYRPLLYSPSAFRRFLLEKNRQRGVVSGKNYKQKLGQKLLASVNPTKRRIFPDKSTVDRYLNTPHMKPTKSKKVEELKDAAPATRQAETPLEALHRRVKQTQQRRIQKRKRIHAH